MMINTNLQVIESKPVSLEGFDCELYLIENEEPRAAFPFFLLALTDGTVQRMTPASSLDEATEIFRSYC